MFNIILKVLSFLSLAVIVIEPIRFLAGQTGLEDIKLTMLIATIAWFVFATPWIWQQKPEIESEDQTSEQ